MRRRQSGVRRSVLDLVDCFEVAAGAAPPRNSSCRRRCRDEVGVDGRFQENVTTAGVDDVALVLSSVGLRAYRLWYGNGASFVRVEADTADVPFVVSVGAEVSRRHPRAVAGWPRLRP